MRIWKKGGREGRGNREARAPLGQEEGVENCPGSRYVKEGNFYLFSWNLETIISGKLPFLPRSREGKGSREGLLGEEEKNREGEKSGNRFRITLILREGGRK